MRNNLFIITLLFFTIFSACKPEPGDSDLTTEIIGTYQGILTLNLGTDSIKDIENQMLRVEKIDNENVRLIPLTYSDESPVDSLNLTAKLTPTPLGFIRTEGVMLTFDLLDFAQGTVNGTPFLVNGGGDLGEHGKYDRETGNLIFALEIIKDGKASYELFDGQAQ